MKQLH